MGLCSPVERKGPGDDWSQTLSAELRHQHVHQRRKLIMLLPEMSDVQAEDSTIAVDHRERVEARG
jgi:hypothetical protein